MSEITPNPIGKLDNAVRQEIFRLTGQFVAEGDPSRDTALVMIAALFVGPDAGAVAAITGCPIEIVNVVADRMRASGLWVDGGTDYSDWSAAKPLGIINFGFDLDIGEGVFTRGARMENGQYAYRLVADGTEIYE
jgi:hypothetical protein